MIPDQSDSADPELGARVVSQIVPAETALPAAPVKRVRKAYEQVYDQLRDLIMRGELSRGTRLPNEAVLASDFGVSRGTVREALRVLAAQNLIRPHLYVPAGEHQPAFGVRRRDPQRVPGGAGAAGGLRGAPVRRPPDERRPSPAARHDRRGCGGAEYRAALHTAVVDGCGNTLICIATQPVFSVLQTRLRREQMGDRFAKRLNEDHRAILTAIEAGDSDVAGEAMRKHMAYLSRTYKKMWRDASRAQ